jgi:hypothetical protein
MRRPKDADGMTRDAELRAILGYLNFSDGAFSPKFHLALDVYFDDVRRTGSDGWSTLQTELASTLKSWEAGGSPFGDASRAAGVLRAASSVMPAYRRFHEDLLHHLPDPELFQPFFVGRVFEQTLSEAAADWEAFDRKPEAGAAFADAVVQRLNDFVGYRPKIVLENRPPLEAYPHERVAVLPLYLKGVGVARGPNHPVVSAALELLHNADPDLLREAWLDLDVVEEIGLDPRAFDHHHPANQRPGHQFGEWDPHRLNHRGRYSRFVTRRVIMKTLERWLASQADSPGNQEERIRESAAVLAGTILLASGVAGGGPGDLTSDHTPPVIVGQVSRIRDRFYADLVKNWPGAHGDRLRKEAIRDRQPFGRLRQHLNLEIGRLRALQLQHQGVAQQYARLGRAEAAEREAERVESPSCRLQCRLESRFVGGERSIRNGDFASAAVQAGEAAALLRRSIECGAAPDPWGLLAFQGQYPLFDHLAESTSDQRIERLLESVERLFRLYARAWSGAAVAGLDDAALRCDLESAALTKWWTQFASHQVSGVHRVDAGELRESAEFIVRVSREWRHAGAAPGDVAFWRRCADGFNATQSYTLILEALLQANDLVAAQALLVHWLGSGKDDVGEETGQFGKFARRWLGQALELPVEERRPLVLRFFELLEANAEERWYAPGGEELGEAPKEEGAIGLPLEDSGDDYDDDDDVYSAAYEDVTYKDSTADGVEGSMMEAGIPGRDSDDLAPLRADLERRLGFLKLAAELFQKTASVEGRKPDPALGVKLSGWAEHMHECRRRILSLIRSLTDAAGGDSPGDSEALGDFGRRQAMRDELVDDAIACLIEVVHAQQLLAAASTKPLPKDAPKWESDLVRVRSALMRGGRTKVRPLLETLFESLRPLVVLYLPLHLGGKPQKVAKARLAREAMRRLAEDLPKAGMFREAHQLLQTARRTERNGLRDVRMVTEFESVFTAAFRSTMETLAALLARWPETKASDDLAAGAVREVMQPFTKLWSEHVGGVRISEVERRPSDRSWEKTRIFIKRYGGELFTQRHLQYGSIRGILSKGVKEHLNALKESNDDDRPEKLLADLGRAVSEEDAVEEINFVLQVVYSHYELFRDYNTTTTQSDYGENIHVLLDLVRASVAYDRDWWSMRPIHLAHRALTAAGRLGVADLLRAAFALQMAPIADARQKDLADAERKNGVILASIRDKINERFLRAFELDRALAALPSATSETPAGDEAFASLHREIDAFASTPTGSGFEAPDWLRKLETEVDRVLDDDARNPPPKLPRLTYAEFLSDIDNWDDDEGR